MKKKQLKKQLKACQNNREDWIGRLNTVSTLNRVLTEQNTALAHWLMSEWVTVHESKVGEVDELLQPFIGVETNGTH